ncbi:MAG TPA: tRNA (adenosine(37)-N6)-threonylcarbamoyltransferase complex ATPase subunit type 1 TsaE [Candidatus Hydrogenedentes bacterium]|nr:tRNA (adenosine(37)-N6)-threonylcarbamoyltransferase complex ATPase subunit type 1 TsaE [Candidatus Hydrogenedentota bacterium]HOS03096.1 tRNA (adenosine(37)-N6)-threonylcarbamoyltransferase complex ATPase subunit type 1 TsaE [Candidatus Hydrogenedentota bacterium]
MSPDAITVETRSPEQTERLGRRLAALLPQGAVVALFGELASGKTCLVRGMASHVARDVPVHSPTFTIVNEYGDEERLYHLDLYRLSGPEEAAGIGCEELFEPNGVCVVEWAERAQDLLPARRVDVLLEHAGEDRRRLIVVNHGLLPQGWAETLDAGGQEA